MNTLNYVKRNVTPNGMRVVTPKAIHMKYGPLTEHVAHMTVQELDDLAQELAADAVELKAQWLQLGTPKFETKARNNIRKEMRLTGNHIVGMTGAVIHLHNRDSEAKMAMDQEKRAALAWCGGSDLLLHVNMRELMP